MHMSIYHEDILKMHYRIYKLKQTQNILFLFNMLLNKATCYINLTKKSLVSKICTIYRK